MSDIFLSCSLPYLRQGLTLNLQLTNSAKQAPGILLSLSPQSWGSRCTPPCPAAARVLRIQEQVGPNACRSLGTEGDRSIPGNESPVATAWLGWAGLLWEGAGVSGHSGVSLRVTGQREGQGVARAENSQPWAQYGQTSSGKAIQSLLRESISP